MRAEPHFNSWQNYDSVSPHSQSCRSWTQVFSWRSSKWHRMLQFYIVWQRCLLDVPYHKYHLLLVSGLPGPLRIWLTFISEDLQGGLSFTAEAWQQERAVTEPSPSRPGKITPKFQWHNGHNQSGASLCPERWERRWAGSEGEEGCCREITYLHHQLVSVVKKYNWCLTACWMHGVRWWGVFKDLGLEFVWMRPIWKDASIPQKFL